MSGFNKVMLYGNLASDPEARTGKSGQPFSTFSIATDRHWKNKEGEDVSQTNFHKVVAFGHISEIVGKYLKKGRAVMVCGRLNNRSYMTNAGAKRYVTEVVMDDFNFLSAGKRKKEVEPKEAEAEPEPADEIPVAA